jgi:telomerase protein component 1
MEDKILSTRIEDPRVRLLNRVSCCLLKEPNYYSTAEEKIVNMLEDLKTVAEIDPEFISQTAYYTRQVLNIRSTSNFLLAFAFSNKQANKYVRRYFPHSINLPTDLIEVVEIYRALSGHGSDEKIHLSKKLQESIRDKFADFRVYQLGKYCSEGRRKRQAIKKKRAEAEKAKLDPKRTQLLEQVNEEASRVKQKELRSDIKKVQKKLNAAAKILGKRKDLSFKKLIRLCHIKKPAFNVMAILGKKYPTTEEEFNKSLLNEEIQFDHSLAGKRMKIPVPRTWETMLSERGNKAEVWEELIKSKQLPFMAMLRNLRNILITGVDPDTHRLVIDRINDPRAIENSKLFPFRFFSAYQAIEVNHQNLQKLHDGEETSEEPGPAGYRKPKKVIIPKHPPTPELLQEYRSAIENAVKIATSINVPPIRGNTVIFCDVSGSMETKISGGQGLGSIRTCKEIGVLMGLMLKYVCESSKVCAFSSPGIGSDGKCWLEVETRSDSILDNMKTVFDQSTMLGGGTDFPYDFLESMITTKTHIDNFVLFSDMMISPGNNQMGCARIISQQIREMQQKHREAELAKSFNVQAASFEPSHQPETHLNPDSSSFTHESSSQEVPMELDPNPIESLDAAELNDTWNITSILSTYRTLVNPNMRFVTVDLAGHGKSLMGAELKDDFRNVLITGYSDSILRLVAELQKNQVDLVREAVAKLSLDK